MNKSNRTPDAYFIVTINKYIGLDLSFKNKEDAERTLASDTYTNRERRLRHIVPYFNIDGKEYLEINNSLVQI